MVHLSWLDRVFCGLKRHPAAMLRSEDGRLFLRCADCGYESAGWQVRPPKTVQPSRKVVPLARLQIVDRQRLRRSA